MIPSFLLILIVYQTSCLLLTHAGVGGTAAKPTFSCTRKMDETGLSLPRDDRRGHLLGAGALEAGVPGWKEPSVRRGGAMMKDRRLEEEEGEEKRQLWTHCVGG